MKQIADNCENDEKNVDERELLMLRQVVATTCSHSSLWI